MTWPRRLAWGLLALVFLVLAAFTANSIIRHGKVLPGVSVAGIDLGGLGPGDATEAVLALEDELVTSPATVVIEGTSFPLDPTQVQFVLDTGAIVESALDAGRRSGFEQLADWVSGREFEVKATGRLSQTAVEQLIDQWEAEGLTTPVFNGDIRFEENTLIIELPRPGSRVDRTTAADLILAALLDRDNRSAVLEVATAPADLSRQQVEAAGREAAGLLAGPIVLAGGEPAAAVMFSPNDLGKALIATFTLEPEPAIAFAFDPAVVGDRVAHLVESLQAPPRDAEITTDENDEVVIIAGRPGTLVDPELIAEQLLVAAGMPGRRAPLPFANGVEPGFTREDAEALGIARKVSEFTTFHPCCQPRVTNIQRIADLVDGVIVMPGDEFSLNEHVGLRTEENGFVAAPMILRGQFVPAVGGGVSQFATTLFNAAFFGGYEDVYHQPHSYYFSRYPEGREATVSFPNPELIFRNDTDSALLIRTEHTDESITVKMFGDNGGRLVTDSLSPRRNYRDPATDYLADPDLAPGTEVVVDRGRVGWTVTVTRVISFADGTEKVEEWDWTYRPQPRLVRVHPCEVPDGGVTCPTTTTAAPPTSSTSTTLP
jgi:vancomycin resistance protein YoaR